jgi:hypothetical protein
LKTLFWLFRDYGEARAAVDALLGLDADPEGMNAIATEDTVKDAVDVDWSTAAVRVSDEQDAPHSGQRQPLRGLDGLLAGEQAVVLDDVGRVYAGGELATLAVNAAASPASEGQGLYEALLDLGVPEDAARESVEGIKAGGVLVAARLPDELASQARWTVENLEGQARASAIVG